MKKGLAQFVAFLASTLLFGATSWAAGQVMTAPTTAPTNTLKPVLLNPAGATQPGTPPAGSGSKSPVAAKVVKPLNLRPSLEILSPSERQSVYRQSILPIDWRFPPVAGVKNVQKVPGKTLSGPAVNIYLMNGSGNLLATIATGYNPSTDYGKFPPVLRAYGGSFPWVVPGNLPEGAYGIRVETADKSLSDLQPFEVRQGSDSDRDGVPDFLEKELAETFAPELRIHPDDWTLPGNVDWYLGSVKMKFEHNNDVDCEIFARGAATQGNIFQKQHKQKDWKRQHTGTRHFSNQKDGKFYLEQGDADTRKGSPPGSWIAYAHVLPSKRFPGVFSIQYWFFSPYNDAFGAINHEGDWEHITVAVDEQRIVRSIWFSQHGYGVRYNDMKPGAGVSFVLETHPVVYVAKGTHASYSMAGNFEIGDSELLEALRWLGISNQKDSTANGGPVWQTWKSYVNVGEINAPMNGQTFIKYGGRWGKFGKLNALAPVGLGQGVTSGPQGPGIGKQPIWEDDREEK